MVSLYKQAIEQLTSQGKFHIELGLERVKKVLELLDNPQDKLKFIHVAGTNGKGSVCAMLSAIVGRAYLPDNKSLKVGLFTSPHIYEYTERIKINDIEINKELFGQKVIEIIELADENQIHLTEFEILTVVTFQYFKENNVDLVILETGLGGRLDATNVIKENTCSVITNIDFDHTERLGDTIEKITYEKAGIIKQNCPVVISPDNIGFKTVKSIADKNNSKIILADEAQNFTVENFALKGTYQSENLKLVLKALEILNIDINEEAIKNGLKNVKHPCRFEYLPKQNIILDGSHNPNGTKSLRESLEQYFPNQNFKFIFGCLRNKDYPKMMENLFKDGDEILFYHFNNPNSCTIEELQSACKYSAKPFVEYKKGTTVTVICGSFYMIKELAQKIGIK